MYRVVVLLLSTSCLKRLLRVEDNTVNHIYLDSVLLAVIGLFKYQNHDNNGLCCTAPVLPPQATPGSGFCLPKHLQSPSIRELSRA